MSDRELLKAAARAAGYTLGQHTQKDHAVTLGGKEWNPRADDGDALRLKVRLCLVVGSYEKYSSAGGTYTPDGYSVPDEVVVWHHETGGDACAAERLAITRCAAAISELMP